MHQDVQTQFKYYMSRNEYLPVYGEKDGEKFIMRLRTFYDTYSAAVKKANETNTVPDTTKFLEDICQYPNTIAAPGEEQPSTTTVNTQTKQLWSNEMFVQVAAKLLAFGPHFGSCQLLQFTTVSRKLNSTILAVRDRHLFSDVSLTAIQSSLSPNLSITLWTGRRPCSPPHLSSLWNRFRKELPTKKNPKGY